MHVQAHWRPPKHAFMGLFEAETGTTYPGALRLIKACFVLIISLPFFNSILRIIQLNFKVLPEFNEWKLTVMALPKSFLANTLKHQNDISCACHM